MTTSDTLDIVRGAAAAAADKKAFDVVALDITGLTSYADHLLICSGASERQVAAISDNIVRQLRGGGHRQLHPEGRQVGGWVLLDYGDTILHVFTEEKRQYYALDNLWGDARRIDDAELGLGNDGHTAT